MAVTPPQQEAFVQLALYLVVGSICFCIDIGGFIALRYVGLPILPASVTSFVMATVANYLLCCAVVFRSGRFSRVNEMLRLFVVATVGLGLNTTMVWLLAKILGADPTFAKIAAVLPVLGWNYLGRRAIVFHGALPPAMDLFVERVRGRP